MYGDHVWRRGLTLALTCCRKRERRSWVGARRVALLYVSSGPPLKTVRTTFMVYGFAPAVPLRVPTKRSFPLLQLHGAFPADSLRVRWVPCSDYYAPSDSAGGLWRFVGVSLTYGPLAFPSRKQFPVFHMADATTMAEVARSSWPHPRFVAPQCRHRVSRCVYATFGSTAPGCCLGLF